MSTTIVKRLKGYLFRTLRIRRRPSNQLMNFWLKRELRNSGFLEIALDVGCGKGINRDLFSNRVYTGVDINKDFISAAQYANPMDRFYVCNFLVDPLPKAHLVVCTLVLHNKHFQHEATVSAVHNLLNSVLPGGRLIFTMGEVSYRYITEVEGVLRKNFSHVKISPYGRFNKPSYLSYILALLMLIWKPLRVTRVNRMLFIFCRGKLN